ncbi:MAG TPA: DUF3558 domain-containing protein [Pseudonocardiaceae bacterium]|nr:DUF3558 domain-containing protein [Pseudonocardiaceae bacterium]
MPERPFRFVVLALVLGAFAAGCATRTVTPGEPDQPAPSATSAPQLPPRPQELRIDGVDPCTLLDPHQRQQLGVDGEPRPGGGSSRGEPACSYDHLSAEPFYGVNIATVPFEGAQVWLNGTRNVDTQIIDVAGFGAVTTRAKGDDSDCSVIVDVAEGQSMDVLFTGDSAGSFTPDEMCEKARLAAEAATRTLLAR